MKKTLLIHLLNEYISMLEHAKHDVNNHFEKPKIRVWNGSLLDGDFSLLPPTEESDPRKWHYEDDTDYIHPALLGVTVVIDKMQSLIDDLQKGSHSGNV